MKLYSITTTNRRREWGMNLTELMVTTAIFGLALTGFLALHIFSLRYDLTVKLKLQASNEARNTLSRIAADIRSAGRVRVGTGDATSFVEVPFGMLQQGNALEIHPDKANTNNFIRYFRDEDDEFLKRANQDGTEVIMARSVTNEMVFSSQDSQGVVLSNNFNNRVIGITLQFMQDRGGGTPGGNSFLYDYYQISTKVTRRSLE
jgi:hypothetical protein